MMLLNYLLSLDEGTEERRMAELISGYEIVYDADSDLPELSKI